MKKKGDLWRILPETKNQITKYVLAPENKGKQREEMANELERQLGNRSPSLDTIKKMISKIRSASNPIDRPWHLGTVMEYPIPPEGVAKVFSVLCQYGRPPLRQKGAWGLDITIREALWISRLSELPVPIDFLERQALNYADAERISEITGVPFETREKDEEIYEVIGYPGQNSRPGTKME
jgi:hypothetical protein